MNLDKEPKGAEGLGLVSDTATMIGDGPGPDAWEIRPRRLTFQWGEFVIGSTALRSLTLRTHFMELPWGTVEPTLPFTAFSRGIDVAIADSYPIAARLPRLSWLSNAIRYVPSQYLHHYIDLSGTFEEYLGKFSSKSRWTLRKKLGKFAAFSGGSIAWRVYTTDALEEFYRIAYDVSEKTYQARLLSSGLPEAERFWREVSRASDARGYLLFHQDKPIAYLFCPVRDDHLLYDYVGFDPEYQQWSPGTILQYHALESLFGEARFQTFDFTEGAAGHKQFFANRSVLCGDVFYFRKSLRNLLIVGLHSSLHFASRASTRLVDAIGLKARLKKLIRAKV